MAKIVVSYPASEGATFDRNYYAETHMPIVQEAWGDCGFEGADVLYPASDAEPNLAMTILHFRDAAAIDAALGSPGTGKVIGDTPNFTNVAPVLFRSAD